MNENLPEVLSADDAIEAVRQLKSLQEILTAPQRQHMADMALWWQEEHGRRQDAYVRETARAISDTFRNVQALGPDVGQILRRVARRRFEMARIAASVERKNWVAEYHERQQAIKRAYSMDGYLEARAIGQDMVRSLAEQAGLPFDLLAAPTSADVLRDMLAVKQGIPEFWRRQG